MSINWSDSQSYSVTVISVLLSPTARRMTAMNATSYSKLAATIFAIIALLQLARALTGWQIIFNGMAVPIWPSWIACGVGIALAWLGFSASRT